MKGRGHEERVLYSEDRHNTAVTKGKLRHKQRFQKFVQLSPKQVCARNPPSGNRGVPLRRVREGLKEKRQRGGRQDMVACVPQECLFALL